MPPLWVAGGSLVVLAALLWAWGHLRLRRSLIRGIDCPQCGGQRWLRVHRQWRDRLFGLGWRRIRCLDCQFEGLRRRHG